MRRLATATLWLGTALLTGYFLAETWASSPGHDKLREQIRSADVAQRIAAIQELKKLNTLSAFKTLFLAAYDNSERVRIELERALTEFTDPAVLEWVRTRGIQYPDKWVRYYSIHSLVQGQGPKGMQAALSTLNQTYPEIKIYLMDRLGYPGMSALLAEDKVLDAAGSMLDRAHQPRLWISAVQVLEKARTPHAVEILLRTLDSGAEWPPSALIPMVHGSLARVKGPGIVDRAKSLLGQLKSPAAKTGALMVLGASEEPAALAALLDFLKSEKDPDLHVSAITAVARHSSAEAVAALVERVLTPGPPEDALLASSALLERTSVGELDALRKRAESPDTDFRLRGILNEVLLLNAPNRDDAPLPPGDALALRRALAWIARTQEDDGHWSAAKHNPYRDRHGFPRLWPEDAQEYLDVQTTAWAVLALASDRNHLRGGPYRENVERGVTWLLSQQKPNGIFRSGKNPAPPQGGSPDFPVQAQHIWATNHLLATLAVLETSFLNGQTRRLNNEKQTPFEEKLDKAIENAIAAIADKPAEGEYDWFHPKSVNMPRVALLAAVRYSYAKRTQQLALGPSLAQKDLSSVVVKFTMETLNKIAESATTVKVPFDRNGNYWFRSYATSAQAISAAVYLTPKAVGTTPIHEFIQQRMDLLRLHPPRWNPFYAILGPTGHPPADEGAVEETPTPSSYTMLGLMPNSWKDDIVNFEYWFWATNSCFIVGEDDWFMWRDKVMPVLRDHQTLGGRDYGSFEPDGPNERVRGRVVSTAQGAICFSMAKRVLNLHNVTWTRVVPRGGFSAGKQAVPKAKDEKKDEPKGESDPKGGDQPGGKMDHPGGKMDHPTGGQKK